MKKLIVSLGLALTLSFGATFDEGVEAFEKGDYKTALQIFEELSYKNNAKAKYNLGVMYENGYGVKQDYLKAKEWYEKAAAQNYASAQYNIGILYYNGYGVKQNYKKAKEWYEKAADQGDDLSTLKHTQK
ncbi:tetratricopeptide repeat protein [Aliarcobacter butzleri]|uniref:tetratricopeptide repeat protein n=1 Tax=Aliarcobacter butzleri TaxID=28197 RepID=UPI002B24C102|nr:tetratricopeptide repeat protein [Aliarcobacter butzleri]